jgi:uracil-DNA glycosylase
MPDNRILVLGQSPGFAGSREASKTIQRVKRWMESLGYNEEEYDWRNCSEEAGAKPKLKEIQLERWSVANYEKVICLGLISSKWCQSQKIEHLQVPHPSGLNRKWNDPKMEPSVVAQIANYLNC